MPRITLSYRRDDSAGIARLIFERLKIRYGSESVFMDIDAVEFGEDYRERFDRALRESHYVFALIGPRWLGPTGHGSYRLNDASDPVRLELETAFELGLRVVPVLLERTPMPDVDDLPKSLGRLTYLNAAEVTAGRDFDEQIDRIIRFIDRTFPEIEARRAHASKERKEELHVAAPPTPAPPTPPPPLRAPVPPAAAVFPSHASAEAVAATPPRSSTLRSPAILVAVIALFVGAGVVLLRYGSASPPPAATPQAAVQSAAVQTTTPKIVAPSRTVAPTTAAAQSDIGDKYYAGRGVARNYATALHWYRLAAARGNADAENSLGDMYRDGEGVPQDYATALHWFQLAAAQGNSAAENNVGVIYQAGRGVQRDYATALHWFRLAAGHGNTAGEYDMGFMYDNGYGVTPSGATALRWYRLAAEHGRAEGQFETGVIYNFGRGVPVNYAEALRWYRLAAAQNNGGADNNLGVMYSLGQGVPQDYAAALHWFQLAAARGEPRAFYHLGYARERGQGVPQDYAKAREYYRRAADAGEDRDAALALAGLYASGKGVAIDRGTAFGWVLIANSLGNTAVVRTAYRKALKTYSAAEQVAGRTFARRFVDAYARRSGTHLTLP